MEEERKNQFSLETYFQTLAEQQQQQKMSETRRLLTATLCTTICVHLKDGSTIIGQVMDTRETLAIIHLVRPLVLAGHNITITKSAVMYDSIARIDMTDECLASMVK